MTEDLSREVLLSFNELSFSPYTSNKISSSQYSWASLLPKSLFFQLQKLPQLFFLFLTIIELFPLYPNFYVGSSAISFTTLITFQLLKDVLYTMQSQKQDKILNNLQTFLWDGKTFSFVKSDTLLVGQIIKVFDQEKAPADILVLYSDNQDGTFYADYEGLVGEVDIYTLKAVPDTQNLLAPDPDESNFEKISGKVAFQEPSNDFLSFRGKLDLDKNPKVVELGFKNMLYRNSKLTRTQFVIGVVIYAGVETKSFFRVSQRWGKKNVINKKLNYFIMVLIAIYAFFVIFSTFGTVRSGEDLSGFLVFQYYLNKYGLVVPFYLFVLIDVIRYLHILYIKGKMHKNSSFLNIDVTENLGKVEYIVSSSSGTLTESMLQVKICMINTSLYSNIPNFLKTISSNKEDCNIDLFSQYNTFADLRQLQNDPTITEFFNGMSLCNSVTISKAQDSEFFSVSRQELAMISICKDFNIQLIDKTMSHVSLEIGRNILDFKVIASIKGKLCRILIETGQNQLTMYVRGSIHRLLPLIEFDDSVRERIIFQLSAISMKGFQIFLLAKKSFEGVEAARIAYKINSAKSFPTKTIKRVEKLLKELEKQLCFIGAFALEENVLAETEISVNQLKAAGIKLWIASGEPKLSTVSTCYRSGIFDSSSSLVHFCNIKDYASCVKILASLISKYIYKETEYENSNVINFLKYQNSKVDDYFSYINSPEAQSLSIDTHGKIYEEAELSHKLSTVEEKLMEILDKDYDPDSIKYNLVIDRESFKFALNHPYTQKMLTCLLFAADSVCFVKFMSQEKAEIVEMLKTKLNFRPYVLAIGDKEADILMMQKADIGVCIDKCGSNYTMCFADVTLTRFSYIRDLVLVYGNWGLNKMAKVIFLVIFNNVLVNFFFLLQLTLSGFHIIETIEVHYVLFFNTLLTCFPIIVLGIEDEYEPRAKLLSNPELYELNLANDHFSFKSFALCIICAVLNALIIFLLTAQTITSIIDEQGYTENFNIYVTILYIVIVLDVLLMVILRMRKYSNLFICSNLIAFAILALILTSRSTDESLVDGYDFSLIYCPLLIIQIFIIPLLCYLVNSLLYKAYETCCKRKARSRLVQFSNKLSSVYKNHFSFKQTIKDVYDLNPYKMKFYSPHIEKAYQESFISVNIKHLKIITLIFVSYYLVWTVIEPFISTLSKLYIIFRIIVGVLLVGITYMTRTVFFKNNFHQIIILLFLSILLYKFLIELLFKITSVLLTAIIPSLTFVFFNFEWLKITIFNALNCILYVFIVFFLDDPDDDMEKILCLVDLFAIFTTLAFLARTLERTHRMEFKLMRLQEINYEKTQKILSFLLPAFVKKQVKDGVRYIAEDQGTVTVLFCDIADFDTLYEEYSTIELITFLDLFYKRLDILCNSHGVTKIETVGKTYMACSGLKDSEIEMDQSITSLHHSKRAINLAFAIIEETKKFTMKSGKNIEVKIGLHSGQVTAGVVGYHKPQFSLVGDTVNTASRMCSTLDSSNSIQISSETYENVPEFLIHKFSPNKVFAKGKGFLDTFIYSANGLGENWNFLDELTSYKTSSGYNSGLNTEKTESRSATKEKGIMGFLDETFRMDTVFLDSSKCWKCSLKETDKEKRFRMDKLESNKDFMKFGLGVFLIQFFASFCLDVAINYNLLTLHFERLIFCCFALLMIFFLFVFFKECYKSRSFSIILYVITILDFANILLKNVETTYTFALMTINIMYLILILCHVSGFSSKLILWLTSPLLIIWLCFSLLFHLSLPLISFTLLLLIFSAINTTAVFIRENQLRNYFNLKALTEKDMAKTEKLLIQMMPPHVLENMKNNKIFTDKLYDVTLLYADIVGFTSWSSNKSPTQIVEMLSRLFTRFDKLCVIHKVYKVHTIGDCYVVMGYLNSKDRDAYFECHSVVNMALSMISVIDAVNREQGTALKMRIGIHTGNIIAGIIGTNIVRYDIYGPDVLIANKMESCGEAGKINVSDATRVFLQKYSMDNYSFAPNKEIAIKAIQKKYMSYFLSVS